MGGSQRAVFIVVVAAVVLASALAAGGTALYLADRDKASTISELRRQVADLRAANERLFSELATASEEQRDVVADAAALRARVASLQRELARTRAQLAAARRAQARAEANARARRANRRALAGSRSAPAAAARVVLAPRYGAVSSTPPTRAAAPPVPAAPSQAARVSRPRVIAAKTAGRARGWGR